MVIRLTNREEVSVVVKLSRRAIVDAPGSVVETPHRDILYNLSDGADYHNEYVVESNDTVVTIEDESPPGSIDISEWPTIRRHDGVNSEVTAKFRGGRTLSKTLTFDFRSIVSTPFRMPAHGVAGGSLIESTANTVDAIASQMTHAQMWDSSGNRTQTEIIPHSFLTGHVWWDGARTPPGTTPVGVGNNGRRFMAITPRHLYACGHYSYAVGETLYWKDINNNIVTRQVQERIVFNSEMAAAGLPSYDMSIYLLSSDLPASIHILPVVGAWATGIVSSTSDSFTYCDQIAGFTLYNNDGHFCPGMACSSFDQVRSTLLPVSFLGLDMDMSRVKGVSGLGSPNTIKDWPSYPEGSKFYHRLRGGDSGSPIIVPCAEGWAYGSHVSTGFHPTPELFNEMIAVLDARAGVSTGHTVTVATDPTL